jgi:hypothetical protein
MKKVLIFFLLSLFLFSTVGCSLLHKRASYDHYVNRGKRKWSLQINQRIQLRPVQTKKIWEATILIIPFKQKLLRE